MKAQKKKMGEDAKWNPPVLIHPVNDARLLPRRMRLSRMGSMVAQFKNDKYYNLGHWSQNWVAGYAATLAFSGIPTHLDFAEDSLVLPTDEVERKAYLHGLENAEEVPRTMHASFDNRDFFAQRIQYATELHTDLRLIAT